MKKWFVLSANNVNTDIGMEGPYSDKKDAHDAMDADYEATIAEMANCGDNESDEPINPEDYGIEADITEDGASVYGGYDGANLYYWNLVEKEV